MSEPDSPGPSAPSGDPSNAPLGEVTSTTPGAGIRYAVLRIALLITVGGIMYLFGLRGWLLLFAAVLVSAPLSFFLFVRQREAAARNLEAAIEARRHHDHHADPAGHHDHPADPAQPAGGSESPDAS